MESQPTNGTWGNGYDNGAAAAFLPSYLRPFSYSTFTPYGTVGYGRPPLGYPLPYPTPSSSPAVTTATAALVTSSASRPLPSAASLPTPSPSTSPESYEENGGPPAKRAPPPLLEPMPMAPVNMFKPIGEGSSGTSLSSMGSGDDRDTFTYRPSTPESSSQANSSDGEKDKNAKSSTSPSPCPQQNLLISIPRLKSTSHTKDGLTLALLDSELWKSFSEVGNEMIVTKPGRRLFPALLVSLKGLNPSSNYSIAIRMVSADQYRYKFLSMRWVPVGESEVIQNEDRQIYVHPNSPNNGQFWMKKPISFKAVKITHNSSSKNGNILLHTMHKYTMEVVVTDHGSNNEVVIEIPETTFIAVTAYQNTKLTQLKIDNNPFAKGFRDRESATAAGFLPALPFPPVPFKPTLPLLPPSQLPCNFLDDGRDETQIPRRFDWSYPPPPPPLVMDRPLELPPVPLFTIGDGSEKEQQIN